MLKFRPTSDDVRLTSVAYIGNNSRTERPTKTKIGAQVAHVTRDSDTIFKVKRSKVKATGGGGILWQPSPAYSLSQKYSLMDTVASHCHKNGLDGNDFTGRERLATVRFILAQPMCFVLFR